VDIALPLSDTLGPQPVVDILLKFTFCSIGKLVDKIPEICGYAHSECWFTANSDHYFRSVCWFVCLFVCLFVCAEFFSAVFDPISIKLGHM